MNKAQFLSELRRRLAYLPASETEKPIAFYAESIDDRVEDGMAEEEAVAALGSIDDIVREIELSLPLSTVVKQRVKTGRERSERGRRGALWVILAVAGFPVWLPLLMTAAALALTVYIVVWAVIVSLFAVLLALAVTGLGLLLYGLIKCVSLGLPGVLMVLGGAAMSVGLALLLFRPVRKLAGALVRLTARFGRWIKSLFLGGRA